MHNIRYHQAQQAYTELDDNVDITRIYSFKLQTDSFQTVPGHYFYKPSTDLQIKLQHAQTELRHLPLERATPSISPSGPIPSTQSRNRQRHNLRLVVDIIIRIQIISLDYSPIDSRKRSIEFDSQRHTLIQRVDDLEVDGIEVSVDSRDPVEGIDLAT